MIPGRVLTSCSHCHQRFRVPEIFSGRAATCSACGQRFLIELRREGDIPLAGDDDELGEKLRIPTLDALEEGTHRAPDVRPAAPLPPRAKVSLPPQTPVREVEDAQSQQLVTTMLLLIYFGLLIAYALWSGHQRISVVEQARDEGLELTPSTAARIWKPLALQATLTVALVAPLFWVGARLAGRLMRVRYQTSGFLESLAIVTVPTSLTMLAILAFSAEEPRVIVLAMMVSLPSVCLLVPGLFGLKLARGLSVAAISIAMALPGFLFASSQYSRNRSEGEEADNRRMTRALDHHREALAEVAPRSAPSPVAPLVNADVPAVPAAMQNIQELAAAISPPVPPAASVAGEGNPPSPPPAVASVPASAPPKAGPSAVPSAMPPAEMLSPFAAIKPWNLGGRAQAIVRTDGGAVFATVDADRLGNHVVSLWSPESFDSRGTIRMSGGAAISYTICPSGETIARIVDGPAPMVEIWSTADGVRRLQLPLTVEQHQPRALGFFDKQTAIILTQNANESAVELVDIKRGQWRRRIAWPALPGTCTAEMVALHPESRSLAAVDRTMNLRVMDLVTGAVRKQFAISVARPEQVEIVNVVFSADGGRVAVLAEESGGRAGTSLFCVAVGNSGDVLTTTFSEPLWKRAGGAGNGRRAGRVIDWIDADSLLAYGELIVDVTRGVIADSVHSPESTASFPGTAIQSRVSESAFVLAGPLDDAGRLTNLRRLTLKLPTKTVNENGTR